MTQLYEVNRPQRKKAIVNSYDLVMIAVEARHELRKKGVKGPIDVTPARTALRTLARAGYRVRRMR